MLEISLRFTIADDTSTDEALIAGFPHDLRAIADHVARNWPGTALDAALGAGGQLARPAHLDVDLTHGGHAQVEVRRSPSHREGRSHLRQAPTDARRQQRTPARPADVADALADLAGPDRWKSLLHDKAFLDLLDHGEALLARADSKESVGALRLLHAVSGRLVDLVARDRSGHWLSVADSPASDPFYVCAVFEQDGLRSRTPLPQLLPEAAESRRAYSLAPETAQILALLEKVIPEKLDSIRAVGRDYMVRRRQLLSRDEFTK